MTQMNNDHLIEKVTNFQSEVFQLYKLHEFSTITNSVFDIESLATHLNAFLMENLKLKNAAFFFEENDFYRIISQENIESAHSIEFQNKGEGIWHIIDEGKPLQLLTEKGDHIYQQFVETYDLFKLNANVLLPFVYKNKAIAIITIGPKETGEPLTEEEMAFLTSFINYFTPLINKFKNQKEKESNILQLQKTLHNISILYNIGQAMNFIDDLKKLIQIILAKALQTIGAERGSLMLYDAATDNLVIKVVYGLPDKEIEKKINEGQIKCTKIKIGEGIAGAAYSEKKAIITNLGENDPRFFRSDISSSIQSLLCLPLIVKDEPIGVINIANKKGGKFFNQDDLDFMGALANQAAIAISNAQLYELAITDSLTKLFIRRHFEYLIDSEIKRSARYKHHISLLMMDIDNFKSINDTYGHQTGDEMLKKIANVIIATIRKIDMPCRYGGEEFAIILPETHKENSEIIAERLRKQIFDIKLLTKNGKEISPSISIGIASFPTDGDDKETLIGKADEALYYAKEMNKNCVAQYNPDGCSIIEVDEL